MQEAWKNWKRLLKKFGVKKLTKFMQNPLRFYASPFIKNVIKSKGYHTKY